ncbi:hypothetical protein [Methanocella sp. MCL-LM]|uniref:hypothetical protein n=1 Tax=Methanocella sp. MCL-LM TaxID=3412035 RepID=UPI003C7542B9
MKKISISLSDDVLEWVYRNKDELKVSTFINKVLRDRMRSEVSGDCSAEVHRLERRLEALEQSFEQCLGPAGRPRIPVGRLAEAAAPPRDVFGELVTIKNVSADNARAVRDELVPFLIEKGVVDRSTVIGELFPRTRSTITNEINYWYNACRGVLDHLAMQGYVVKEHRSKYRWSGKAVS